jgi:2-methylcitrate dehydratase
VNSAQASSITLPKDSNQALGIGQYAIDFIRGSAGKPAKTVLDKTLQFHTDALLCGASALAMQCNAPVILRNEAFTYQDDSGATVFGSPRRVKSEKAVVAMASAVREWDSNGTNFGYNPELGHTAGEFGHNDYYPVCVAACQESRLPGETALLAMVCLDEIRGRLAEVFSLKSYKIDHVVHGAIASAAVYGAIRGATAEQIESAIGMFVAHYIPWRAIRAGKQLSDSKGASAAISAEAAVLCMKRSMDGFLGPRDIFRNPESMFRQFERTNGDSPFDLVLATEGEDFAVMGMHFKLGLYEHQSAGALQAILDAVQKNPAVAKDGCAEVESISITAYEPAFGIIGDPAKRDPRTRQSADHSMLYIVSTLLRRASEAQAKGELPSGSNDEFWKSLMLLPKDYGKEAIFDETTRSIMEKIEFVHGGEEYDSRYPQGIPTSVRIRLKDGSEIDSGLVMFPAGHARNETADLNGILQHKWQQLAEIALPDGSSAEALVSRLEDLPRMNPDELLQIYNFPIAERPPVD